MSQKNRRNINLTLRLYCLFQSTRLNKKSTLQNFNYVLGKKWKEGFLRNRKGELFAVHESTNVIGTVTSTESLKV